MIGKQDLQEMLGQGKQLSARELRHLPLAERDVILAAAAEQAEAEYRADRALTAFEAFVKEDLRGESANTETR
jgi:hypothetical protein